MKRLANASEVSGSLPARRRSIACPNANSSRTRGLLLEWKGRIINAKNVDIRTPEVRLAAAPDDSNNAPWSICCCACLMSISITLPGSRAALRLSGASQERSESSLLSPLFLRRLLLVDDELELLEPEPPPSGSGLRPAPSPSRLRLSFFFFFFFFFPLSNSANFRRLFSDELSFFSFRARAACCWFDCTACASSTAEASPLFKLFFNLFPSTSLVTADRSRPRGVKRPGFRAVPATNRLSAAAGDKALGAGPPAKASSPRWALAPPLPEMRSRVFRSSSRR